MRVSEYFGNHSGRLLSDEHVQAAFDWLLDSSASTAAARGKVLQTEHAAKAKFAELFLAADGSVDVRKAKAQSHPDYDAAYQNYVAAEQEWERCRDLRNKCELVIEAWRTECSNERGIQKMR